ncbi:MAG: L-aspartate oxidase, partial [Cyanobacteriota bacterium]|nr:L-aspartate oxidase [Cyanobacteriota bacterium]
VGETSSTGVHGANRLASNSLLECLVYGAQMSQLRCDRAPDLESSVSQLEIKCSNPLDWEEQYGTIKEIKSNLPDLIWQSAGICRNQQMLEQATNKIEDWRQTFINLSLSKALFTLEPQQTLKFNSNVNFLQLRTWGETCNLLDIAYLILKSSIFRQESRGGHYRQDYPQTRTNWQVHTLTQGEQIWTIPLKN